ncbi:GNAT family N-acetyltransferase [Microbacterium sp. Clip185]|uniref:GNAT family N-acetyltransferase n=1 Tax=Microbacterium sp. Clip185 TaxID=3025663 RepID=UPI0023655DAF|nr:GNAT family protein [Microbacterium sp. Clip185]WDG17940.1 GNAT family protein [Microbacterium sp. Clip185]
MTAVELREGFVLRPLAMGDASALADAYRRNREHLAPWEPLRPERFFTQDGQEEDIAARAASAEAGAGCSLGVFHGERIVGRFNLAGIVRGPFQSGGLGYWVDRDVTGRGIATSAVRAIVTAAREELGLHRLEASTLTHNHASQSVLRKAGFEQIGFAPRYLQIAGRWQDHNLYQVILHT